MSLDFFYEHIEEELCSAKEYITLAIEKRSTRPEWSKTLVSMSSDELTHATDFYKMFETYYADCTKAYSTNIPEYLEKKAHEITECYAHKASKVKYLHEMYANK